MNTRSLKSPDDETRVYMETQHHRGPNECVHLCASLCSVCVCVCIESELVLRKVGIELLRHVSGKGLTNWTVPDFH